MSEWILKEESDGVTFKVRVQPNASRNEIVGVVEGALRVRLTAPPVEGAANKECIRFLSKKLHLAKSRITLVKGERSRDKVFRVEQLGKKELQKELLGR